MATAEFVDAITPVNLVVAFAAGVLSFLSPCMLPLVPGYLGWLGAGTAGAAGEGRVRRMGGAALFVAGFALVFVALGAGAGVAGTVFIEARGPVQVVGGIIIMALGLAIIGERFLPPRLQGRIGATRLPAAPTAAGAVLFGVVFGAAWSPCIGPTLGAILTLAAAGADPASGALLLAIFAAGLGVPFLLIAYGFGALERLLPALRPHLGTLRLASGVLLVVFGALLALGLVARLSSYLSGIPGLEI